MICSVCSGSADPLAWTLENLAVPTNICITPRINGGGLQEPTFIDNDGLCVTLSGNSMTFPLSVK